MLSSFKRSCLPREAILSEWNLSLILRRLTHLPYKPLKLSADKHLTWKTCFLLALTLAKRVGELHGLSFRFYHSKGQRSCIFLFLPDFRAKTQNPSVSDSLLEKFVVPSLADFMGGDRDKMVLFPIRAIQGYLGLNAPLCSS